MAVLIEGFSVIVRRAAMVERFRAGWAAFLGLIPNQTFCQDEDLARIGFMDAQDAAAFQSALESGGLIGVREGVCVDMALIDQMQGLDHPAPWLESGDVEDGGMKIRIAWLSGRIPEAVEFPRGWRYEGSLSASPRFVPENLKDDLLKYLRTQDGVDVYLDTRTGKEVYAGRTKPPAEQERDLAAKLSHVLREAMEIERRLKPLLEARDEAAIAPLDERLNRVLRPAVEQCVLGAGRDMALAHFTLGVLARVGFRMPEAESAFRRANQLRPGDATLLNELVRCLGERRKPGEALPFAREAVQADAKNAQARANLAICLFQCGETAEALAAIESAIALAPDNPVFRRLREDFAGFSKTKPA